MKRFFTVVCAICMVFAFACVSFAAPEGKIKTKNPPTKEPMKVDKTKAIEPKGDEKKDPTAATKGKKVEKKEEPKKGDK
jgi:hypothetical protein